MALAKESNAVISSATLAEVLVVATRGTAGDEVDRLFVGIGLAVVSVTAASARGVAFASERWGRRMHRAGLNFGDYSACSLTMERRCCLLDVGGDFAQTDVRSALPG